MILELIIWLCVSGVLLSPLALMMANIFPVVLCGTGCTTQPPSGVSATFAGITGTGCSALNTTVSFGAWTTVGTTCYGGDSGDVSIGIAPNSLTGMLRLGVRIGGVFFYSEFAATPGPCSGLGTMNLTYDSVNSNPTYGGCDWSGATCTVVFP